MSHASDVSPTTTSRIDALLAIRRRRRRRIVVVGLLVLIGLGIYIQCFQSPRVALGVLMSQVTDGGGEVTAGDVSDSPSLAGQMTAIKSNQSTSTGSTTSRSSGSAWPRQSIAIFCESDHLLMQRVGLALFEGLQASGEFEQVQYVPQGKTLPLGQDVPDLLVTLRLTQWEESGMPLSRQYKAKIMAGVGREYAHGNTYTHGNSTPPVVQFSSDINMDYTAQQTGFETAGAQYTAVSKDIAKALQKSLLGLFDKDHSPALPEREQIAEFYPEFESPPAFPFLEELNAQVKFMGSRFMQPTSAAWTFSSDLSVADLREKIDVFLSADGWKTGNSKATDQEDVDYRGSWHRGPESFEILPEESGVMIFPKPARPTGPIHYRVIYTRTMTDEQADQAFRAVLSRQPNEAVLLPFVQKWYLEKDQILAYFAEHQPQHADAYRILAEWKLTAGEQDQARELVLQGHAMDQLVNDGSEREQFRTLAKKVGLYDLPARLDPAVIETLGLKDFREGQEFEITAGSQESVVIWVASDEQGQTVLKLRPVKKRTAAWSLSHEVMTIHEHGSSHTSSGTQIVSLEKPHSMYAGLNEVRLSLVAEATDNPQTIRFRISRQKRSTDE